MKINLKNLRQAHDLFQSDMAELLDINQSNISRAELKGFFVPTYPQLQKLYDKFGKEEVDTFVIADEGITVNASNNSNKGNGTQNNGYFEVDATAMEIIRKQTDVLMKLAEKQAEQADRLLDILEKLSEK